MKGFRDEEFKMMMNSSSSSSSINNDNSNKNEIIIYDGDPVLWSPFITRYHMDLRMRGLSYILNDEEITKILQEPSPPVYQLAHNSWPEDSLSREQRIAYNISIGQSYASAHKHWEGRCCKAFADFETASYILLERVSSQISSEVFGLLTTQQIGNSKERYNAVWNLIFKHYGPHNQSHIRNQLTKCDPYTEGWLSMLEKFDSAIATLRKIPYCNSKTGLGINDEDGRPITFEPTNEDLLGYMKRHLSKAPAGTALSRVHEKLLKTLNISFEEVANDIRSIFAKPAEKAQLSLSSPSSSGVSTTNSTMPSQPTISKKTAGQPPAASPSSMLVDSSSPSLGATLPGSTTAQSQQNSAQEGSGHTSESPKLSTSAHTTTSSSVASLKASPATNQSNGSTSGIAAAGSGSSNVASLTAAPAVIHINGSSTIAAAVTTGSNVTSLKGTPAAIQTHSSTSITAAGSASSTGLSLQVAPVTIQSNGSASIVASGSGSPRVKNLAAAPAATPSNSSTSTATPVPQKPSGEIVRVEPHSSSDKSAPPPGSDGNTTSVSASVCKSADINTSSTLLNIPKPPAPPAIPLSVILAQKQRAAAAVLAANTAATTNTVENPKPSSQGTSTQPLFDNGSSSTPSKPLEDSIHHPLQGKLPAATQSQEKAVNKASQPQPNSAKETPEAYTNRVIQSSQEQPSKLAEPLRPQQSHGIVPSDTQPLRKGALSSQPLQSKDGLLLLLPPPPSRAVALPDTQPSQANSNSQSQQGKGTAPAQAQVQTPVQPAQAKVAAPSQSKQSNTVGTTQSRASNFDAPANAKASRFDELPRTQSKGATPVQPLQQHKTTTTGSIQTQASTTTIAPTKSQPLQEQLKSAPLKETQPKVQNAVESTKQSGAITPSNTSQAKASSSVGPQPGRSITAAEKKNSGLSAILAEYAMHAKQQQHAKSSSSSTAAPALALPSKNQCPSDNSSPASIDGRSVSSSSSTSSSSSSSTPASSVIPPNTSVQSSTKNSSPRNVPNSTTEAPSTNKKNVSLQVSSEPEGLQSSQVKNNDRNNVPAAIDSRADSLTHSSSKPTTGHEQGHHQQQAGQYPKSNSPRSNNQDPATQPVGGGSTSKQDPKKLINGGSAPCNDITGGSQTISKPVPSNNSYHNQERVLVRGTPVSGAGRTNTSGNGSTNSWRSNESTPVESHLKRSSSSSSANNYNQPAQKKTSYADAVIGGSKTPQPNHSNFQQNQANTNSQNKGKPVPVQSVSKDVASESLPLNSKAGHPSYHRADSTPKASTQAHANLASNEPSSSSHILNTQSQPLLNSAQSEYGKVHNSKECDSLKCRWCNITFETASLYRDHNNKEYWRHPPNMNNLASEPQTPSVCKSCGEAHLTKTCRPLKCHLCEETFETVSSRRKHKRNVHNRDQSSDVISVSSSKTVVVSAKKEPVIPSKGDIEIAAAVVVATQPSQPITPKNTVIQMIDLVPYDDEAFCQNCLERGHVSVDCSKLECGICFEVFHSSARRVAHSFLMHRDIVNVADYCPPILPRVQLLGDTEKAVAVSSSKNVHPLVTSNSSAADAIKRSRSPESRDDDQQYFKKPKASDETELEEIVKVQREQMTQLREDIKAQQLQMESLQMEIEQHKQEMKQDREGTHAQRQVMKQQQDMINRQQEESQQLLYAFQEESEKITRRLLDVLHHRLGGSSAGR